MPRIFDFARIFGRGAGLAVAQARAAELRGDLAHAAVLFAQAGRLDEAARVMVLRGDAEPEPAVRLRHYLQAVATAPPGSVAHVHATRKRAGAVLAMAGEPPLTAALRHDVTDAARALEGIGEHALAAEAYARAGDVEGQVRALARAGDIERLDAVLAEEHGRNRDRIARVSAHGEATALASSGSRREALALARASSDPALREKGQALARDRATGSVAHLALHGRRIAVALGETVVLGRQPAQDAVSLPLPLPPEPDASSRERSAADAHRSPGAGRRPWEGTITIASPAVSRRHLAVARRGEAVVVRDLGSRNGTTLRGLRLTGEVPMGGGIELLMGGEVPVVIGPTDALPGAVRIDVGGPSWIAPLGPAWLGVGRWRLERGEDDWLELVTEADPAAFAGPMLLAPRVTLLEGDAFATSRGGPAVLEVRATDRGDGDHHGPPGERP